jgi:hypothetical protein
MQDGGQMTREKTSLMREPTRLGLQREPTRLRREGTSVMLPNPNPPKKRKKDIFNPAKFAEVDKKASKVRSMITISIDVDVAKHANDNRLY